MGWGAGRGLLTSFTAPTTLSAAEGPTAMPAWERRATASVLLLVPLKHYRRAERTFVANQIVTHLCRCKPEWRACHTCKCTQRQRTGRDRHKRQTEVQTETREHLTDSLLIRPAESTIQLGLMEKGGALPMPTQKRRALPTSAKLAVSLMIPMPSMATDLPSDTN